MTTFTRVMLNPAKRGGRKLLLDPQSMHAAVRAAFPPDLVTGAGRVLWRLDSNGHEHLLYIVAPEAPDAMHLVEQAGWSTRPPATIDYDALLDGLRIGQEWRFRLRGNPVHSVKGHGDRGVVKPHVTVEQQAQWLIDKSGRHGFELIGADEEGAAQSFVRVSDRRDVGFGRRRPGAESRDRVQLRTALFDGLLRVTDREAFRDTLVNGLGRGKAYGCGLLTVARPGR